MEKMVEIYRKEKIDVLTKKEEELSVVLGAQVELERLREAKNRAVNLGYTGQVRAITQMESRLLAKIARVKISDIPYPKLTPGQWEVLCGYFNRNTDIHAYDMEVIPPLVLMEVERAHTLGVFDRIRVCYHWDPKADPLICGCINDELYLIARFGDALQPWKWFQEYCCAQIDIIGAVTVGVLTWGAVFSFSVVMADESSISRQFFTLFILPVISGAFLGTLFQYLCKWRRKNKIFAIPSPFPVL